MVIYIKDNLYKIKDKDKEKWFFLIEINIQENGLKIELKDKEK